MSQEGFRRWLQDWDDAWSDWDLEVEELLDAGGCVVVFVHMTATGAGSGAPVDRQDSIVYTIEAGRIARIDYFNSREQGLRAAALSGSTSSPGER